MTILFFLSVIFNSAIAGESEAFVQKVVEAHELSPEQARAIRPLLMNTHGLTRNIGTEDLNEIKGPNNSYHMASRQACIDKVITTGLIRPNPKYEKVCGAKWMSPVPVDGRPIEEAKTCIDQFEFPNIPCEYPVVWTTSASAKRICESMGKRVCNSHEWEGACAGKAKNPDFNPRARRAVYNSSRPLVWAFQWQQGLEKVRDTRALCGVYSANDYEMAMPMKANPDAYFTRIGKSLNCQKGPSDFASCGTNSWPSGFKYDCRSEGDVFDMHGNLAEVTSLPETESQVADGKGQIGGTERKGSFFVHRGDYPDDCHVRQPFEHFGNYAVDKMSYYQEGFRCCKDVEQ